MGFQSRRDFSGGWCPDCDAVNAPENVLLRADNLILDERGVLALRPGSLRINLAPLADTDIHSLFTTSLGGTRYRMAGATNAVYANGSSIKSGMAGSDDIAFGFHLGQILFARSTSKFKFDGTTVRNWGIAMTGALPTVSVIEGDSKTFATGASGESPAFTTIEDDGTGPTYGENHYLSTDPLFSATGALVMHPAATNRAIYQKTFPAPEDFTIYDAGQAGVDDDIITWYLYVSDPALLTFFSLQIDVNDGTFLQDWYSSPVVDGALPATTLAPTPGASLTPPPLGGTHIAPPGTVPIGTAVPRLGLPTGSTGSGGTVAGAGWMKVSFRRGDFVRIGSTDGKDWATVKAIRLFVAVLQPTVVVKVDTIKITGGAQRTLLGSSQWRYIYVRNASGYQALSAPSDPSLKQTFNSQAAAVTIPPDPSRDAQVNEIWLFRQDQLLDTFYRVGVQTGVSGTGSYTINDLLSAQDALTLNIPLQIDNTVPPNNIIAIVGPHYDRTLVLTSDGQLWPSRKLDPDAFATGQTINVCGLDETPYWMLRALNDLFVGTSKDIYRLDGTGAELPDGTIDYVLRPLSMDHRPINGGLAHEGDQVAFFSDDGWRATQGMGSQLLTGLTSLLYRGETRHGVSPVNMTTGRVRAALGHGHLIAITPEGASTVSSSVLYRYVFAAGQWYRHPYAQSGHWRSLYREPDGTLIAGDDAGTMWSLDSGVTTDDGQNIPITCWTKVDDLGLPHQRKKAGDLQVRSDTGGANLSIAVHLDNSASATATLTATQGGMGVNAFDLADALPIAKQFQFRMTGSLPSFHLYDYGIGYRERPVPIIGRVVDTVGGSLGVKILSGFILKGNTLGVARVITPFLDGVATTQTFTLTTSAEEPETHELLFTSAHRATDIGLAFDGEIEIDQWSPIITQRQPVGVLVWDSGPIDLGDKELVWLREMLLKVRAGADLTITPWFDGVAFPTVTGIVTPDVDTIVRVPVGRAYVGRQPRLVVTSCAPFYPYWVRCIRRTTGSASQKPAVTVPFTLETGGAS